MKISYGDGAPCLTPVPPGRPLTGRAVPPGSKSITNRALLVAALAHGTSRLTGALKSVDTELMATALGQMGVAITEPDATGFVVTGRGRLAAPKGPLFLGNAGTATRFLTAAAATVDGTVVIDGDEHMRMRPIAPLVAALRALGVDAATETGCPPVTIYGTGSLGGPGGEVTRVEIDGSLSSQYVSAVLMAAPFGAGPIEVVLAGSGIGARGYVDLTLAVMRAFGGEIDQIGEGGWRIAPTGYRPADFAIEPDASAATYLWGAAALTRGDIDLGITPDAFTQPDAAAHAHISNFPHMPAVIEGAQMQDAVPTLAVLAAFNATPVRFTGIANLRVKECDRISALVEGLNALAPGLAREEGDDLIVMPEALAGGRRSARIETHNDHRIAMSFALAGLRLPGVAILNPACTAKTYPSFWRTLSSLGVEFAEGTPPG